MGGGGGPPSKGGLGWGPDWISNWMEPKSFVVGKTRSGRPDWGFTILHPKDLHSDREEGLGPKKSIIFQPSSPLQDPPSSPKQDGNLYFVKEVHMEGKQDKVTVSKLENIFLDLSF